MTPPFEPVHTGGVLDDAQGFISLGFHDVNHPITSRQDKTHLKVLSTAPTSSWQCRLRPPGIDGPKKFLRSIDALRNKGGPIAAAL
jgi:hypothetical protein